MSGRRPKGFVFILEPRPGLAVRLQELAAVRILAVELPTGGGCDFRGLLGLPVVLECRDTRNAWVAEIAPLVISGRPAELWLQRIRWTEDAGRRFEVELVPLECVIEQQPEIPWTALPTPKLNWWEED